MIIVGIDTGGTFTDFVAYDGDGIRVHKELSTPLAPERAILAGLHALGIDHTDTRVVHGSTVATNTLLEGTGARTVFITNRGFGDTLTIGRQARAALYDLTPPQPEPPVARELCLETGGRVGADGVVVEALTTRDEQHLRTQVLALNPQAVAVSLLFSFLNPEFERRIASVLPADLFISISSEVLPEYREYERGIATWLNATTGPVMHGYLARLAAQLKPVSLTVMQSSGVTCEPEFAAQRAVNLLLSGPAGGLLGAQHVARLAGHERIITFDMGGTSTDVALIDGAITLTSEGHIGRYPVGVPMVDMHTIGAGGGSLAIVDEGGLLHVGPQSAGAVPGPACYGAGGDIATVTDANLVLGRLPASARLGGTLALDVAAAERAMQRLARQLGDVTLETAAQGVIDLANDHMCQALNVISVARGIDPREFTLVSFGGAGGLHVCALATALGMRRALVPADAGVLSALGLTVARPGRRLSRTVRRDLEGMSAATIEALFIDIAEPGLLALEREGYTRTAVTRAHTVDVCYRGQSFAINVPWTHASTVAEQFQSAHAQRYGHRLEQPLELVNLRVALDVEQPEIPISHAPGMRSQAFIDGTQERYPVHARADLLPGTLIVGPAVVYDDVATAFIDRGWHANSDAYGNLLVELG